VETPAELHAAVSQALSIPQPKVSAVTENK
jgi:hypothetical protein